MEKLQLILLILCFSCSQNNNEDRVDMDVTANSEHTFSVYCYGWQKHESCLDTRGDIISSMHKDNVEIEQLSEITKKFKRLTLRNIAIYDSLKDSSNIKLD